jgi:hypothetical protein
MVPMHLVLCGEHTSMSKFKMTQRKMEQALDRMCERYPKLEQTLVDQIASEAVRRALAAMCNHLQRSTVRRSGFEWCPLCGACRWVETEDPERNWTGWRIPQMMQPLDSKRKGG